MVRGVRLGLLVPGGQADHGDVPGGGAHHPADPAPPIAHDHHNGRWPLLAVAAILQEGLTATQIRVARVVDGVVVVSLRAGRGGGGQGRRNGQLLAAGLVVVAPGHCRVFSGIPHTFWGLKRGFGGFYFRLHRHAIVFYYYYWNFPYSFARFGYYFRLFICKLICFLCRFVVVFIDWVY